MSRVLSSRTNFEYMTNAMDLADALAPRLPAATGSAITVLALRLPDRPPETEAQQDEFDDVMLELVVLLLNAVKDLDELGEELEAARKTLEPIAKALGAARAARS